MDKIIRNDEDENHITCPSCRHRFKPLQPYKLIKGKWELSVNRVFYENVDLKLTNAQCKLLFLIAKSPVPISTQALSIRVCREETHDISNSVCVQLTRLKRILRQRNIPIPFEMYLKEGYIWLKS